MTAIAAMAAPVVDLVAAVADAAVRLVWDREVMVSFLRKATSFDHNRSLVFHPIQFTHDSAYNISDLLRR
jgi:hypothetical protein